MNETFVHLGVQDAGQDGAIALYFPVDLNARVTHGTSTILDPIAAYCCRDDWKRAKSFKKRDYNPSKFNFKASTEAGRPAYYPAIAHALTRTACNQPRVMEISFATREAGGLDFLVLGEKRVAAYTSPHEVLAGILRRCRASFLDLEKDDRFFAAMVIGSSVLSSLVVAAIAVQLIWHDERALPTAAYLGPRAAIVHRQRVAAVTGADIRGGPRPGHRPTHAQAP